MRAALIGLCASVFLAACGDGGGVSPDAGGDAGALPAELVLGAASATGEGFVPVSDGDDAELISGSQGGFHVWIAARLEGASGTLYLDREARRQSDGTLVLRAARAVMEVPESAESQLWQPPAALPSFMCPAPVGVKVFDEPIVFRAVLLDEDETVLGVDELVLVPRCPDGDERDFCVQICSG